MSEQHGLYKGIYEFEDPSGSLIAAKIPNARTADLYSGTRIVVKPNQCALFVYNGKVTDILASGSHEVKTENLPLLTRITNWKFGFESPLRCEIIFISGQIFTARKWGTAQPALVNFGARGNVPIRGFGNYNIWVFDPAKFFSTLMGTRDIFEVSDLDDFVQGQLLEIFPNAMMAIKDLKELNSSQEKVSSKLESTLTENLKDYGIRVGAVKTISLLPSNEVLKALDETAAMQVIGNQKQYMIYKMANSFDSLKGGGQNDPLHMMIGLMMGKNMMGLDDHESAHENIAAVPPAKTICSQCGGQNDSASNFCSKCGGKLSK